MLSLRKFRQAGELPGPRETNELMDLNSYSYCHTEGPRERKGWHLWSQGTGGPEAAMGQGSA